MSIDNEYLWRRPGSPTIAEKLLDAAAADAKRPGAYTAEDDARHRRRLAAMRSLGDAERHMDRVFLWGAISTIAVLVAAAWAFVLWGLNL